MKLPKRHWMEMTWQDVAEAGAETARWIAVLPLAAVEQHGPHLPLGVDTFIAEAYLARVRQMLSAGATHRRLCGTCRVSWHVDTFGGDRDCRMDRAWRKPGARRHPQTCARHQSRRQCRGHGTREWASPRPTSERKTGDRRMWFAWRDEIARWALSNRSATPVVKRI
jgi:Creatinine amidohydrolase